MSSLAARRAPELAQIAGQITQSNGKAVFIAGDVTDETYATDLVTLAEQEFGGLDGAFNNAGIIGDIGPVPDMDIANWRAAMDANLTAAFFAAKAQIPILTKRVSGSIVFTGSFVDVSNGGMPVRLV
jgi:NAD(P)-dependent dehydrogenase (short-subunit alcohol dehydrogenase family)